MKAIAGLVLFFIISAIAVGTAAVASVVYKFPKSPVTNSTDPLEIVGTGIANAPWGDLYDFFFGGLLGVLRWIVEFFFVPGMNAIGKVVLGHSVFFPFFYGYLVFAFILLLYLWRKKDSIYGFVSTLFMWLLIGLAVVFVLAVFVKLLGVI